jgi:hypothetical protein
MHFDFNIGISQVVNFVLLIGTIIRVEQWGRRFLVEHEILIRDYCKRNDIDLDDLPTRGN